MSSEFKEIFARLKDAWGASWNYELASGLGVRPQAVSRAVRLQRVPPQWLERTQDKKYVQVTWLQTGDGPKFVTPDRPLSTLTPEVRQLVAIAEELPREDFEVLLCLARLQRNGDAKMRQHLRAVSEFAARAQARESSSDSFDGNTPSELACNS